MKFSDLLKQPISTITENDILKDIVQSEDTLQNVLDKVVGKSLGDILVVYVDGNKKVKGVLTAENITTLLDFIDAKKETSPAQIKVTDFSWNKGNDQWLYKDEAVEVALKRLAQDARHIFIVVDRDGVYSGKIKRKNAVTRVRSFLD